jgi:DNA processing protein
MTVDDRSGLVGLSVLPSLGPKRFQTIVEHYPPGEAFSLLAAGRRLAVEVEGDRARGLFDRLRAQARGVDCEAIGVSVVARGDPGYPVLLAFDPDPPNVLFVRGRLDALQLRTVGIVGTRNATAAGRATAFELGQALADNEVAVVSGLARGIDAAAHRGVRATDGIAIAVVGSGPDLPYPKQNADLWEWVAGEGLLVSEWPPGTEPEPWRFPLRNRIIAALSEALVVVESRETGGSLITALAAGDRGVTVMAVPGSTRSPAARGTNKLLVDGATPVTCVDDVLVALGLDHSRCVGVDTPNSPTTGCPPEGVASSVLEVCVEGPATLDEIAEQLRLGVSDAAVAVRQLESLGFVTVTEGWIETVRSRLATRPTRAPATSEGEAP